MTSLWRDQEVPQIIYGEGEIQGYWALKVVELEAKIKKMVSQQSVVIENLEQVIAEQQRTILSLRLALGVEMQTELCSRCTAERLGGCGDGRGYPACTQPRGELLADLGWGDTVELD